MHELETQLAVLQRIRSAQRTDDSYVTISRKTLSELIAAMVGSRFDEAWYLSMYPDVGKALKGGLFESALHHYAASGVYEGRLPFPIPVDEPDYMRRHPDVDAAVKRGAFPDGEEHFLTVGFAEGRSFRLARV